MSLCLSLCSGFFIPKPRFCIVLFPSFASFVKKTQVCLRKNMSFFCRTGVEFKRTGIILDDTVTFFITLTDKIIFFCPVSSTCHQGEQE